MIPVTSTAPNDGNQTTEHPGVICDVCDDRIIGTRFKCLACPDYDLCGTCEGKGFHPEHEMLRIRTPRRHPLQSWWTCCRGVPGGTRGGCDSWEPSVRSSHQGRHGPFGHCRPNRPLFVPPFVPGGCHGTSGSGGLSWAPSNEDRHTNNNKKTCENGEDSVPPFLNALGDVIASFLEPFGMDVETFAENSQGSVP